MGNQDDSSSPFMTTSEVASYLGYKHMKAVADLARSGYLTPLYIPKTCRPKYLRKEVEGLVSKVPYEQPMGYQKRKEVPTINGGN